MKIPWWVKYGLCGLLCVITVKDVLAQEPRVADEVVDDRPYYHQQSDYHYLHGKHHCYSYGSKSGRAYEAIADTPREARNTVNRTCSSKEKDARNCVVDVCVFK